MNDASPPSNGTDHVRKPARAGESSLRAEVGQIAEQARRAMMIAGAAVVLAVLSPLWSPWLFNAVGGSDQGSARVLVIAIEQLRSSFNASAPFDRQLALVRKMMAGDREVTRALDLIEPAAADGVPTARAVRGGFMIAANRVFVAEALRLETEQRWVRAILTAAAVVRPHDVARSLNLDGAGPATAAMAAAAERIAADDLGGAIQAVEALPASYAPLTARWLAEARRREAALRGWATLEALAASRLPGSNRR